MSIFAQATAGIKWSSASLFVRQLMLFITIVILARLLSPADFGLVGMATIINEFAMMFKDLGTSAAVIQRKDLSEELLSSIFWVNVAFGAITTVILIAVSPLAALYYHEPKVTLILRVLSLTFCISGLSILQQAILERDMAFNTLAKLEIIATAAGSVVSIGLALLGAGVWCLVLQSLVVAVVSTLLLWTATDWRPKRIFHLQEVLSISSYSMHLTGFNIFNYFIRNADYLLIGRFLGAQSLGYYTLAYRIMLYPLQSVSSIIGRVMFPMFSKIQHDNTSFRYAYLKVTGAIALITFPMMFGLWVLAEPFVLSVFGSQWKNVTILLLILAPVGLMQSIGTTVGLIYQAKGRADWLLRWGVAAGIFYVTLFLIGIKWGIVGVASAYAIGNLIILYPSFAIPFRLISLPISNLLEVIWRPFLCSSLMLFMIVGIKAILPLTLNNVLLLSITVPLGVAFYFFTSWFFNRDQLREILNVAGVKL